jgi:hypothetical protein
MYQEYCAACHGNSGNGHGLVARAIPSKVADLTTLTARNGGKFPYGRFDLVMRFGTTRAEHGSTEGPEGMPVWEPLFASLPNENEATIHQRIVNLADYVNSLQAR